MGARRDGGCRVGGKRGNFAIRINTIILLDSPLFGLRPKRLCVTFTTDVCGMFTKSNVTSIGLGSVAEKLFGHEVMGQCRL